MGRPVNPAFPTVVSSIHAHKISLCCRAIPILFLDYCTFTTITITFKMAPAKLNISAAAARKRKALAIKLKAAVANNLITEPPKRLTKEEKAESCRRAKLHVEQEKLKSERLAAAGRALTVKRRAAPFVVTDARGVAVPAPFHAAAAAAPVVRAMKTSMPVVLVPDVIMDAAPFADDEIVMYNHSYDHAIASVHVASSKRKATKFEQSSNLISCAGPLLKLVVVTCFVGPFMASQFMGMPARLVPTTMGPPTSKYSVPQLAHYFTSTIATDSFMSDRCAMATAMNRVFACPAGGICEGGELVTCGGFDNATANALVVSADRTACSLSADAQFTFQTIYHRLQDLVVADFCSDQSSSIAIRNHGSATMVDYFDLALDLEKQQTSIDAATLSWLQFALENGIVSGLALEWTADEPVWIGLSAASMQTLVFPSKCIAQRAMLSTIYSTKSFVWDSLMKHSCSFVWFAFCQNRWTCIGLTLVVYLCYIRLVRSKAAKEHNKQVNLATPLVFDILKATNAWTKVGAIRDEVKERLYPGDDVAQAQFVRGAWKSIIRYVDRDARIGSRDLFIDGRICSIWKWQGMGV
ncbi:hypothetical protein MPSEU_000943500 [Mayamaea pseudoterrestris]|nr:hypothetical protein MPSEU_000943500 [Mayamaea pseudoterrestris]